MGALNDDLLKTPGQLSFLPDLEMAALVPSEDSATARASARDFLRIARFAIYRSSLLSILA